jgi:hypothetical protein
MIPALFQLPFFHVFLIVCVTQPSVTHMSRGSKAHLFHVDLTLPRSSLQISTQGISFWPQLDHMSILVPVTGTKGGHMLIDLGLGQG